MKNILFLFIGVMILVSSCKPTEVTGDNKKKTGKSILKQMLDNSIDFEWFSAKIKANYKSEKESVTATLQVKIEQNKQIWISGQKFGIEGLRVLIDQDSIRILNRIKRTYQVADFSYIQKEFNLPANYQAVQDFLVGNPLKMSDEATYQLKENAALLLLIGIDNNLEGTYSLNKLNYNLENFILEDTTESRKVMVQQLGYQATEKHGNFSYSRVIDVESEEAKASVTMNFSRVVFDEQKSMSFSVPSSYKRL